MHQTKPRTYAVHVVSSAQPLKWTI